MIKQIIRCRIVETRGPMEGRSWRTFCEGRGEFIFLALTGSGAHEWSVLIQINKASPQFHIKVSLELSCDLKSIFSSLPSESSSGLNPHPTMIEEIDSQQYINHYFDKIYSEVGHDADQLLSATVRYLCNNSNLRTQDAVLEAMRKVIKAEGKSPSVPAMEPAPGFPPPVYRQPAPATSGPHAAGTSSSQQQQLPIEEPEQSDVPMPVEPEEEAEEESVGIGKLLICTRINNSFGFADCRRSPKT